MTIYSMDFEDMNKNANIVKEAVLSALEKDGLLKKPAGEIAAEYAIVVSKAGWFGTLWKRLKAEGNDSKDLRYDVVKSV